MARAGPSPRGHAVGVQNPKVIVEVLSDSTERYDRGEKFAHYLGVHRASKPRLPALRGRLHVDRPPS